MERAYLAGFFDGEGCIRGSHKQRTKRPKSAPRAYISISQKEVDILNWVLEKTGVGRISKTKVAYVYFVSQKEEVVKFIELILPYSIIKKPQLELGLKLANLVRNNSTGRSISEEEREVRVTLSEEIWRLKNNAHQGRRIHKNIV